MYLDYINLYNVSRLLLRERPVSLIILGISFLFYCLSVAAALPTLLTLMSGILGIAFGVLVLVLIYVIGRAVWKVRYWPTALGCGLSFICMILAQLEISVFDWRYSFANEFLSWAWNAVDLAALIRVRGRLSEYAAGSEDTWGLPDWLSPRDSTGKSITPAPARGTGERHER